MLPRRHATSLPSLSLSLSLSSVLSGVRALVTTSLPGVVSHGRGACVATPRPFLLSLSLPLSLSLSLSLSLICPFGGACAGNHVLAWGGVPRQGCVCCHATSLLSLSHLCPFGGACAGNHVLAWGGVPRQGCVCCHATSLLSLSLYICMF